MYIHVYIYVLNTYFMPLWVPRPPLELLGPLGPGLDLAEVVLGVVHPRRDAVHASVDRLLPLGP